MKTTVRRVCLYVVGALYLATWMWGIPAAHTRIAGEVIGNYKTAVKRHRSDVGDVHPWMAFGPSYAILPFVSVNHYEYHVGGVWAFLGNQGGLELDDFVLSCRGFSRRVRSAHPCAGRAFRGHVARQTGAKTYVLP